MDKNKSKNSQKNKNKKKNSPWKWVITIFVVTFIVSGCISFFSNLVLESSTIVLALVVLLIIVFTGIIFDIIGVAVTAVDEGAIHGMASRRVKGAVEATNLVKNANRVSSICNDVIGDICGVISGSATAVIATRILLNTGISGSISAMMLPLVLSAVVAALTVSGKAVGKIIALDNSEQIVLLTGRLIAFFKGIFRKGKQ